MPLHLLGPGTQPSALPTFTSPAATPRPHTQHTPAVLHAAGRTFPVTRMFLEDVYGMTGYRLASDAPAALRRRGPTTAHQYTQSAVGGSRCGGGLCAGGCVFGVLRIAYAHAVFVPGVVVYLRELRGLLPVPDELDRPLWPQILPAADAQRPL